MSPGAAWGISVAFSFVTWGIVTWQYIWPSLSNRTRAAALRPILLLHGFRFFGLVYLVPGVVSPDLPGSFARPVAYGDFATAILALLAFATLRRPLGTALTWAFNIVGTVDLLNAFYQGNRISLADAPGLQGAAYVVPTLFVPILLITHALVFRLLLRADVAAASPAQQRAA